MSEKSEKATAYKLQKAREQGHVSQSAELTTAVFLLVIFGIITALWSSTWEQIKSYLVGLLASNQLVLFKVTALNQLIQHLNLTVLRLWSPFALASLLSIIITTIAQTGLIWSTHSLVPQPQRLSISLGFKRLFSSKTGFVALKHTLKLSVAMAVFYISLTRELPAFLHLLTTEPRHLPKIIMPLFGKLILQLLALLLILALVDKSYSRWKYAKDNRMSKQDLKEEYRQREGDPSIKVKRRQLQHELRRKNAELEQIKTADVIITNPHHLAIALKYERGQMPAPKIICKAQGELAKQVKRLAAHHHVPMVENIPLARALFALPDHNHWVSRDHFSTVAMIFRDIYQNAYTPSCNRFSSSNTSAT